MTNPNDPAYPNGEMADPNTGNAMGWLDGGLTKREYFAGLLMAALLSHSGGPPDNRLWHPATRAVRAADALIMALAEEK